MRNALTSVREVSYINMFQTLLARVEFFLSHKRRDLLRGSRFAAELLPEFRGYRYKHLEVQA
jgi:hypothetical protein